MDVLLTWHRGVSEVGSGGALSEILARFPSLRLETNFEQVLGMIRDGEVARLIIWTGGRNWSGASDGANMVTGADALWVVNRRDPKIPLLGVRVGHGKVEAPPGAQVVPSSAGRAETVRAVSRFLST